MVDDTVPASRAESSGRGSFSFRCYVMGLVWIALGLGLAIFSYNQRLIEVTEAGLRVVRNDEGMLAGYGAIAFGVFWLGTGVLSAWRRSSQETEGSSS